MRTRIGTAVLGLGVLVFAACEQDVVHGRGDPAGRFSLDGGVTARADTGVATGPSPDAGPAPGLCACPATPRVCVPPAADAPIFSFADDALVAQLAAVIGCANRTLQLALYETSWGCIVDHVANRLAENRDLQVQLVIDDDRCPVLDGQRTCPWGRLADHPRVTIVDDARSAYMHHKMVIADGARVWLSSANMTINSFCNDVNDGLVLEDRDTVAALVAEFDRLYLDRDFGPLVDSEPLESGPYTVRFSPVSPISAPSPWFDALLASIDAATRSVDVMIYALTRDEIAEALTRARSRGVAVRVLVHSQYAGEHPATLLRDARVELRVARVHTKAAIIDGRTVFTGSANWSANSWANNELSLTIEDPSIASKYTAAFERTFSAAPPR